MESVMRQTGIHIIGEVPWGTHFCQFYETGQDLIDILVPYFKEGLDAGEFCMWVTSEPLEVDQATAALRAAIPDLEDYINKGQIEILDYSQWYTRSGKFSADEVLQGWVDKLNEAQKRGFEGLRLTGNTFWLEKADWEDFTRYEETVNNVIGRYKMLAICTYSLQKCNALEILDVIANHQFALIKRAGRWEIIESGQHKKTEQALQESEKKLSSLYSSMVEGVALHEIVYDSAGNPVDYIITDVNPSYEKITGLSRDNAFGKRASVIYGTGKPPYLGMYARVASSGKPESFETYFEPMKKHFSISVFSPAQGKFATVFSDITERKQAEEALKNANEELQIQAEELQAQTEELLNVNRQLKENEEALRQSEQRFCLALKNSPVNVAIQDRSLVYQWAYNQRTRRPEEIIGKTDEDLFAPEDIEWIHDVKRKVLDTGTGVHISKWLTSNSQRVFLDLHYEPLRNADGEIVGIGVAAINLTEQELAKTALREREKELQRSHDLFKALVQNLNSGVALIDEYGKFTIVNPAFLRMFGLSDELSDIKNVNDQNWGQWQVFDENGTLLHVDNHPVRKAAMTGKPVRNKLVGMRLPSGGDLVWMLVSAEPTLKPDGRIDLLICTYHDVTKRWAAEEALRETQNYLENLIDYANAPIIVWDTSLKITRFNHAFERLTGLKASEALGEHLDLLFPEDTKEQSLEHIGHTLSGERWEALEIPILHTDGSVHTVLWNSANIYAKDDKTVIATIAQGQDITARKLAETERKRIEHDLKIEKDTLQAIMEYTNAQIAYLDPQFNFIKVNSPYVQGCGHSAEELIGRNHFDLFPSEENEVIFKKVVETGEPVWFYAKPFEYIDQPERGITYWDWSLVSVKDDTGQVQGLVFSLMDVTSLKRIEKELRRSRDELELKVAERTAELSHAKEDLEVINKELQAEIIKHEKMEKELFKATEAAEAASETKEAFMANMSHELRTPMNYIVGMTSLLLDEPLTPELREYVETIRKGSDEMMAIINDILDFSKIEKEKVALEYQRLSLQALVDESIETIASQAMKKGLNLATTIKYGTPDNIVGDQGRLQQILVSLLSNAVKFTDEGEISVSVSSKPLQKTNKHQILFAVRDTGIGIPPEKMTELFQPFAQVETTISRKRDGVGLGLATNKKLVELMGGEIWARSEVGKGSTFYFTIEAEIARDSGINLKPEETIKSVPKVQVEQHPPAILIAEDVPSNQKVLMEMLKRMGYRADAVADGKEVLQALEMRHYDLIFMDVKMPVMDGIAAAKEIRRRWPDNGPKIIAITAYALHGDKEKCLAAGMDGYIAKPVQKEDLAEVLENMALNSK